MEDGSWLLRKVGPRAEERGVEVLVCPGSAPWWWARLTPDGLVHFATWVAGEPLRPVLGLADAQVLMDGLQLRRLLAAGKRGEALDFLRRTGGRSPFEAKALIHPDCSLAPAPGAGEDYLLHPGELVEGLVEASEVQLAALDFGPPTRDGCLGAWQRPPRADGVLVAATWNTLGWGRGASSVKLGESAGARALLGWLQAVGASLEQPFPALLAQAAP